MDSSTSDTKSQVRRAIWLWPGFLLALMTLNLLIAAIAITVAVGDPSFQPIPSYQENGVDWEARKQLQMRSDSLGWTALVQRDENFEEIRIALRDPHGLPLTGATGTVQAYHFTRAGQAATRPAIESPSQPGVYLAKLDVAKDGRWHVTVRLSRNEDEEFLWDQDVEWYR
jgi:hypothetical protein